MSLVTLSAIFLRWAPHHGFPILTLFAVAVTAAAVICLTQLRRYNASSHGISQERVDAEIPAVLWTASAGVLLGALGILVVHAG